MVGQLNLIHFYLISEAVFNELHLVFEVEGETNVDGIGAASVARLRWVKGGAVWGGRVRAGARCDVHNLLGEVVFIWQIFVLHGLSI